MAQLTQSSSLGKDGKKFGVLSALDFGPFWHQAFWLLNVESYVW